MELLPLKYVKKKINNIIAYNTLYFVVSFIPLMLIDIMAMLKYEKIRSRKLTLYRICPTGLETIPIPILSIVELI